ncbi:MAG: hypothetical protein IKA47_01195 [Oscillospiraceae bacterium]|nr:hypothetical protein [Oscillospiraceae bacterium]
MERPEVKNILTREKLEAFPIKNKNMTTDELRQLCVDFFRFSKTALWICNHDVDYTRTAKGAQDRMEEGQVYGGLPYIGHGSGNVYRTLDYMDEQGVVDISRVINRKKFNKTYDHKLWRNFGNQCANGAYVGWGRVLNSAKFYGTTTMTQANGFLRVGPYKYDDALTSYKEHNTVAICAENGEQTMFESYAAMELADGIVNYGSAGHVLMCTGAPVVVKNADGSINGQESYICVTEQAQTWKERENDQGDKFLMKPSVDRKMTFAKLFEKNYLPFTFAEFTGAHPVEDTWCKFSLEGDTITDRQLFKGHITANYGILDAYAIVTDDEGKEIYKHAVRSKGSSCWDLAFVRFAADPADHNNVETWGKLPVSGEFGLKLEVQLATGERPVVYAGKLQVEKPVVAPLTWDKINAFPIKNKNMTTDELRQLCADFFRFAKRMPWICDHDVDFIRNASGTQDRMEEGRIYGGLPYIGLATGNPYRLLDYMDENGVVNIAGVIGKKKFNKVYERNLWRNFGNQCANGCYVGWGRVINSADYSGTPTMQVCRGFLRVGPYKYDDSLSVYKKEYNTVAICKENGEQTMFESYAAMQLADGLVNFTTAGHVIMCTIVPEVVRNADGTIDGQKSFLHITEQAQTWQNHLNEDGFVYQMKPSVDDKRTFNQLLAGGYLPFTFAEFQGTHPIEDTWCKLSVEGDAITARDLFKSHITSNYGIYDAYATVTDDAGKEVYWHAVRCLRSGCHDLAFCRYAEDPGDHNNVEFRGEFPGPGTYNVKIDVQLATGERPCVYQGKLEVEKAVVTDPLTWDKINAFPIKYKGMPVAERRQLCADFFRFQKRVNWTPDSDLAYTKNPHGSPDKMREGTVYRGFPYVTVGSGNVYRMMDYIDEKGYIDIQTAASPARKFGNQCAAGVFGGWGRLVNSPNYSFTVSMTVANGFQRVGPYTYDDTQEHFGRGLPTTYDICAENGEQVMFQSYAALEIADVMVNYGTAGHIIMCTIAPEVVYNEDGTIDGEKSFLHITDQAQTWLPGYEENGDSYEYKNNIDWKRTFAQLLKGGYLPMTVPELTGEKDIDDTEVSIDLALGTVTAQELFDATVTANFGITDVYSVFSKDGKQVYKLASRADINNRKALKVKTEEPFVDSWGEYPEKGVYDLQVLVQLYTGERITVYEGKVRA